MPRYKVAFELKEREQLEQVTQKGKIAAAKLIHARALLLCDQGEHNSEPFMVKDAAKALGVSTRTIENSKKRFVEEGLQRAIERKRSTRRPNIKFDREFDARIMQLACSQCPKGAIRWTLRLLADKAVELEIVDSVSTMMISSSLKKNRLRPHLNKYWKIPPDENAGFVASMEDILEVYQRRYDRDFPVVYMDESTKQLIAEVADPIPMTENHCELIDHEYMRNGVATIFAKVEPLGGRRHIKITGSRTAKDWANFVQQMLDERISECKKSNPCSGQSKHP